jgi:hypothetical protein
MDKKTLHGRPIIIMMYNDKKYVCKNMIERFDHIFSGYDNLRDMNSFFAFLYGLFQREVTPGTTQIKDFRQCLLHNGYQSYNEFKEEFAHKQKLLEDLAKDVEYEYQDCIIKNEFEYLGTKTHRSHSFDSFTVYTYTDEVLYYKHRLCGGVIKQTCNKRIFVCKKCGNTFNHGDVSSIVFIKLRE